MVCRLSIRTLNPTSCNNALSQAHLVDHLCKGEETGRVLSIHNNLSKDVVSHPSFGLAQGLFEGWITLGKLRAISSLTAKGTQRTGYFCGATSPVSMCNSIRFVSPRCSLPRLNTSWYSSSKAPSCSGSLQFGFQCFPQFLFSLFLYFDWGTLVIICHHLRYNSWARFLNQHEGLSISPHHSPKQFVSTTFALPFLASTFDTKTSATWTFRFNWSKESAYRSSGLFKPCSHLTSTTLLWW